MENFRRYRPSPQNRGSSSTMVSAQFRNRGPSRRRIWMSISATPSPQKSSKPMNTSEPSSMNFSKWHRYGAIYADPPWHFRNWSAKGTGRNAVSHYDCLDFNALACLPVADLAKESCVLFLWATDPLLPRALELIRAWGFEYKTVGFYWVKLNAAAKGDSDYFTGLGYWTRANPE